MRACSGGLINKGPQLATLTANSSFGVYNLSGEYWANNFNDISSGMVVCFELLVVNNWYARQARQAQTDGGQCTLAPGMHIWDRAHAYMHARAPCTPCTPRCTACYGISWSHFCECAL